MITRTHQKGDAASVAVYSDCERYRYSLTRVWDADGSRALFIMLNPSTATEVQNDPTVERCERRARALGFGAFRVLNIFAWRATDPRDMRAAADPVGPAKRRGDPGKPGMGAQRDLRLGHPWRASGTGAGGRGAAAIRWGRAPAPGPVEGRAPQAPPLHRLRRATGRMAGARLTASVQRGSVANG
jgi:hypothetical protein